MDNFIKLLIIWILDRYLVLTQNDYTQIVKRANKINNLLLVIYYLFYNSQ